MSQRVHIDNLSYGPHGVGRLDGKVVFVRGVIPGEDVDVVVREDRGSFAFADAERIVEASAERRQPPCRFLPLCGGCPWQHIQYDTQLRAKENNLRDHLTRHAGIAEPPMRPSIRATEEFGYRHRLTLRTEDGNVGFIAGGSHALVPVDHCLLATPEIDAAIPAARSLLGSVASLMHRIEIVSRGGAEGVVLVGEVEGKLVPNDGDRVRQWLALEGAPFDVRGVVLHGRAWRRVWGDESIVIRPVADLPLVARAGAFTQVTHSGNMALVNSVLELGAFTQEDIVLDLYSGIGNLTLPIARRVKEITAVEQSRLSAEDGRRNAQALGLSHVEIVAASARDAMRRFASEQRHFDVAVLDPPRSGAAEILDTLIALAVPRLVYVSCNPATLARDLKRLKQHYRIDAVQPVDLFPQTYHLEAIVHATLVY